MNVRLSESHGVKVLESAPCEAILVDEASITLLLETCFNNKVKNLLLYSNNIDRDFFNLSTGFAGTVLQKLRNYHIRLAIVKCAGVRMSKRFSELLNEEGSGNYFRMFQGKHAAESWLRSE